MFRQHMKREGSSWQRLISGINSFSEFGIFEMVPSRIMGTHSVVKWKSEIILWSTNSVCLPGDSDPLYQNLEHTYWYVPLWGHLVSKTDRLLGGRQEWSTSAYFLHCFIKISVSAYGLNPLLISINVQKAEGNVHKKECTWQHLLGALGWPVTGHLGPGNKYISAVTLHRSMNNQEASLQNHFISFLT